MARFNWKVGNKYRNVAGEVVTLTYISDEVSTSNYYSLNFIREEEEVKYQTNVDGIFYFLGGNDGFDIAEEVTEESSTPNPRTVGRSTNAQERKERPIITGVLDYFPDALCEVAYCSFIGNKQHNPGQPLHWDRSKSTDQADTIGRHMLERGTFDSDGVLHSAKVAWRALAQLQLEIEELKREEYKFVEYGYDSSKGAFYTEEKKSVIDNVNLDNRGV